jgi:hypothetical protein
MPFLDLQIIENPQRPFFSTSGERRASWNRNRVGVTAIQDTEKAVANSIPT